MPTEREQMLAGDPPMNAERRREEYGKPIDIGSDVWVGGAALILSGVRIGSPSVIGLTTEERARLKQLKRENLDLRRANEILRLASARTTTRSPSPSPVVTRRR